MAFAHPFIEQCCSYSRFYRQFFQLLRNDFLVFLKIDRLSRTYCPLLERTLDIYHGFQCILKIPLQLEQFCISAIMISPIFLHG